MKMAVSWEVVTVEKTWICHCRQSLGVISTVNIKMADTNTTPSPDFTLKMYADRRPVHRRHQSLNQQWFFCSTAHKSMKYHIDLIFIFSRLSGHQKAVVKKTPRWSLLYLPHPRLHGWACDAIYYCPYEVYHFAQKQKRTRISPGTPRRPTTMTTTAAGDVHVTCERTKWTENIPINYEDIVCA